MSEGGNKRRGGKTGGCTIATEKLLLTSYDMA